jgi:hypothetical protein
VTGRKGAILRDVTEPVDIRNSDATIVEIDFFEAPGLRYYRGGTFPDDKRLRELYIDRIFDVYVDEKQPLVWCYDPGDRRRPPTTVLFLPEIRSARGHVSDD